MNLHRLLVAAYGMLLWVFPRHHRDRYGREILDAFGRELVAVRERAGAAAALRFALRGFLDAVLAGAGERRRAARERRAGRELGLGPDLRHAVRSLARSWGYTLVCLFSLASGLGVTAAVMLLYRTTMEPPFELDEAGLVEVIPTHRGELGGSWSYPDFLELDGALASADLAAWTLREGALRAPDADVGEPVQVAYVSARYFRTLRLEPTLGRLLGESDGGTGGAVPVVIAHGFWKNVMGGDSAVVGREIVLNRAPHVIVGVAPEWFRSHDTHWAAHAWVPLETHPLLAADGPARHDRGQGWLGILGRVPAGSSLGATEATASSVVAALAEANATTDEERGVRVLPWHWQGAEVGSGDGRLMAAIFGTLCTFLMLVVCLNLAGMGMVRSASRERELALRLAIGSGRRRLVQVLMAEALVLAAAGGVLVVGVAWLALRAISWRWGVTLPSSAELDAPLIAVCLAAALGTSLVFGLVPALRFSRPDLLATIKDDAGSGGRRSGLMHRITAAAQAGLAVPVLVVAVGVTQAALTNGDTDFGVREEGFVLWTPSGLVPQGYDSAAAERLVRDVAKDVGTLPGVQVVALADGAPLDGEVRPARGYTPRSGARTTVQVTRVGPGYLEALGVPLLGGRSVGAEDVPGSEPVAVLTATLAETLYPGSSPLGRRLLLEEGVGEEDDADAGDAFGEGREVTIVGVAADFASHSGGAPRDHVLLPLAQDPSAALGIVVRTDPPSRADEAMTASIERVILEHDRELARPDVVTFREVLDDQFAELPIWSAFFGVLAILLLLLSALGIYGVVAFTVASRTREIGARMSLGSSRGHVLRQVLWDGIRLAVPGLFLGSLAGAAVAAFVLNEILVEMELPLVYAGTLATAAAASLAVVLLASLLPARRAAGVDPLKALRAE